jgi:hypothetical protein
MPRQDPAGSDPSLKPAAAPVGHGRKDPHARWADGAAPFTRLLQARADRKYVLCSKNDQLTIGKYISLGYERETNRPDGPRFLYGESAAMGDYVETMDLILLSCSMELHLEHYKYGGVDGAEGQQYFDTLENKIIDRVGDDATRGIHARRGWATVNETESAYVRHSGT